jgi:hypothetical protein
MEALEIALEDDELSSLEEEDRPLVRLAAFRSRPPPPSHRSSLRGGGNGSLTSLPRWMSSIIVVGFISLVFFVVEIRNQHSIDAVGDTEDKPHKPTRVSSLNRDPLAGPVAQPASPPFRLPTASPVIATIPVAHPTEPPNHAPVELINKDTSSPITTNDSTVNDNDSWDVDPNQPHAVKLASLQASLREGRTALWQRLEEEYGSSHAAAIFADASGVSRGRLALRPPLEPKDTNSDTATEDANDGWQSMVHKFALKLLQNALQSDGDKAKSPFVWATGGHSATAGHGNFYDESYTAVLEDKVVPILEPLGIAFQGRNYAMGGTPSGPEIASCIESVFGSDPDVLVWDTGMTDGNRVDLMGLYLARAALLPSRPVTLVLHHGAQPQRLQVLKDWQAFGLPILQQDERVSRDMNSAIPETLGLNQAQIDAMPPFVRQFKCEGKIESGDPGCADAKWNSKACTGRKFRTSWHPGWKWHAIAGNLYALFVTDIVQDALTLLQSRVAEWPDLREELLAREAALNEAFRKAPLPAWTRKLLDEEPQSDIDLDVIFRQPSLCHTARLPAEIRYLGILTDTMTQVGFSHYDKGLSQTDAMALPNKADTTMRLAYDPDDRQDCNETIQMDYKDFFLVHEKDGWQELTLPNDREVEAYSPTTPPKFHGYVAICFAFCDWDHCKPHDSHAEAMSASSNSTSSVGEMQVNGVAVTNLTTWEGCEFLRNLQGHRWLPDNNGKFTIRARITETDAYFRFSSFIIW